MAIIPNAFPVALRSRARPTHISSALSIAIGGEVSISKALEARKVAHINDDILVYLKIVPVPS